jgi:hypothetical protein
MSGTRESFLVNRNSHDSNGVYYESRITDTNHVFLKMGGANVEIDH